METQFKIFRFVILGIGTIFLCIGAGIAYFTYSSQGTENKESSDYIVPVVFMFIGLMDILTIVIWSVITGKKAKKEMLLIENGYSVQAKIISIDLNKSVSMNRKNPFNIICQWKDPVTSVSYIFKSKNIWFDPSQFIDHSKTINVFCDPDNMKNYVVDTTFLPLAGQ
jgi:cytochrome bd-type quinol oxidase subunit 2